MDEKPEEVVGIEEDKHYTRFQYDGFKIKTGDDALENFKDKLAGKADAEEKMLAWTQGKMRLLDAKKPVKEGSFDKASKRFLDHIFKDEMKEARKQTRLTDQPTLSSVIDEGIKHKNLTITAKKGGVVKVKAGNKRGRPRKVRA